MRRHCKELAVPFEITDRDLAFYEKIAPDIGGRRFPIPPPTLSPEARMRRRLTFRNERTLYRRRCDQTGAQIVSVFAPEAPFPVYNRDYWFSDGWDALEYGREFDFSRPFFEQFAEMMRTVPAFALYQQGDNENCPFTNLLSGNRNCYYIFAASDSEDCFYSTYIQRCTDVGDSFFIFDSELCYECIDTHHAYRLRHSQDCDHCTDSDYLIGCVGCANCFGCVSMIKASYCIFNRQYSKTEYRAVLESIAARPDRDLFIAENIARLCAVQPRKYYSGISNEASTGDHLAYCKNAEHCFDCTYLEDCKYCTWMHRARDCYDCYAWGISGELGLENHLVGANYYHVLFSDQCSREISKLLYCRACYGNCSNLFGCIGLKQKQYCILNKHYGKTEYETLLPRIIEHMQRTAEWGEFFPQWLSPYGYNETVADEYFPLPREEVLRLGWNYRDLPLPGVFGKNVTGWDEAAPLLDELSDELAGKIFRCESSGKNFRYSRAEIQLYRKLDIAPPRLCFDERYRRRFLRRNPRRLFPRNCIACNRSIQSAYEPGRPEQLLCEECFARR